METKLKPCPFCGKNMQRREAWTVKTNTPHQENAIVCGNCGAQGPNDLGWSGAEEMWNLRREPEVTE